MRIALLLLAVACTHAKPACPAGCSGEKLYPQGLAPDAVDKDALALCPAPPSTRVDPKDVEAFFGRHLDDARLKAALPPVLEKHEQAAWLASIWSGPSRRNAFTHVLCGDDWDRANIGGLHLESRYAQLESEGKVCYDGGSCRKGRCDIAYRGAKGFSCAVKEEGGFVQGLDAIDVLAAGSRAYLACCLGRSGAIVREKAYYRGPHDQTFLLVCGDRNGQQGIVTFYPVDDSPDCGP